MLRVEPAGPQLVARSADDLVLWHVAADLLELFSHEAHNWTYSSRSGNLASAPHAPPPSPSHILGVQLQHTVIHKVILPLFTVLTILDRPASPVIPLPPDLFVLREPQAGQVDEGAAPPLGTALGQLMVGELRVAQFLWNVEWFGHGRYGVGYVAKILVQPGPGCGGICVRVC